MNVDMPKNLTYSFCTTDGGTTITVEKCRYAAECISTKLETDNRSRIGFETLGDNSAKGDIKVDNKVDNNARGDINVDNKVDNNVGDDTVNDTVKHPQIRTRTTPVQHPYNETQFRTTTVPIQDTSEVGCRHDDGHAGRVTLPARKRLNHRGPLSIDVSSAWYFITICAAERCDYGRAVSTKPPLVARSRVPRDRADTPPAPCDCAQQVGSRVPRDRADTPSASCDCAQQVGSRVPRDRDGRCAKKRKAFRREDSAKPNPKGVQASARSPRDRHYGAGMASLYRT
jgi:hypothetical protein